MTNEVYIEERLYNDNLFLQELFVKGSCILIIKFSLIKDRLSFYKNVASGKDNDPFVIDIDIPVEDEDLQWLIRISFSPTYYKRNAEIILFTSFKNTGLVERFLQQGYGDVVLINLLLLPPINIGKLYGYINKEQKETGWDLILTGFSDNISHKTKDTIQQGEVFRNTNLHEQLLLALNNIRDLESQLSGYKMDLENHKKYLEIALRQRETENILEFYHKQYEVLPLWYKKFGHLLKILSGKRKLKS